MANDTQSTVSSCDVTHCTYNQQRRCTAGSITVMLVEGMAHCGTFQPADGSVAAHNQRTQQTAQTSSTKNHS